MGDENCSVDYSMSHALEKVMDKKLNILAPMAKRSIVYKEAL
jgi:hypothetical protein